MRHRFPQVLPINVMRDFIIRAIISFSGDYVYQQSSMTNKWCVHEPGLIATAV